MARYPDWVYQGTYGHEKHVFEPTSRDLYSLMDELDSFIKTVQMTTKAPKSAILNYGDYEYPEWDDSGVETGNKLVISLTWHNRADEDQIAKNKVKVDKQRAADKKRRDAAAKARATKDEKLMRKMIKDHRDELEKLLKEAE